MSITDPEGARVRELERRIEEIESLDDAAFGHFTRWDWVLCVTFAVVAPILVAWRCGA